ncbi:hypothetical protein ACOME3_005454 [Neoechinorhynchus agilis]
MEAVSVAIEVLKLIDRLVRELSDHYEARENAPVEIELFLSFLREMRLTVDAIAHSNPDSDSHESWIYTVRSSVWFQNDKSTINKNQFDVAIQEFLRRMRLRLSTIDKTLLCVDDQAVSLRRTRFICFSLKSAADASSDKALIEQCRNVRNEMTNELALLSTQKDLREISKDVFKSEQINDEPINRTHRNVSRYLTATAMSSLVGITSSIFNENSEGKKSESKPILLSARTLTLSLKQPRDVAFIPANRDQSPCAIFCESGTNRLTWR